MSIAHRWPYGCSRFGSVFQSSYWQALAFHVSLGLSWLSFSQPGVSPGPRGSQPRSDLSPGSELPTPARLKELARRQAPVPVAGFSPALFDTAFLQSIALRKGCPHRPNSQNNQQNNHRIERWDYSPDCFRLTAAACRRRITPTSLLRSGQAPLEADPALRAATRRVSDTRAP